MNFEERMNEVREMLRAESTEQPQANTSPSWDEEMFKNGWPNCWGDFSNIMM